MVASLRLIEFMVYHDEQRCKGHEDYDWQLNYLSKGSLSGIDFSQQSNVGDQTKAEVGVKRASTRLKSTLGKQDAMTIMTDVSDGEDDVQVIEKNTSPTTESYQRAPARKNPLSQPALRMPRYKGKAKINVPMNFNPKLASSRGSVFCRRFSPKVHLHHAFLSCKLYLYSSKKMNNLKMAKLSLRAWWLLLHAPWTNTVMILNLKMGLMC